MALLTLTRIRPLEKLLEDIEAALTQQDDIAADFLREIMPEWKEAVNTVNSALGEIQDLLSRGLRDEALGLHALELIPVARRFAVHDQPTWPDIASWILRSGLAYPPVVHTDTLDQLADAESEVAMLANELSHLRRLAVQKAPAWTKLSVLRHLRAHDSHLHLWERSIASHEEACVTEALHAADVAFGSGDFDTLTDIHAALVDPDWLGPIPNDLIDLTKGAELAKTASGAVSRLSELYGQLAALQATCVDVTDRVGADAAVLLDDINHTTALANNCFAQLKDCKNISHCVERKGITNQFTTNQKAARELTEWASACIRLHAARDTFTRESQRLEYLCDQGPGHSADGWLTEVQRCEADIRRACQEFPDLSLPIHLQERVRRAQTQLENQQHLRTRFRIIVATCILAVVTGGVGFASHRYWKFTQRSRAVTALEDAVKRATAGAYTERPSDVAAYAGTYATDSSIQRLLEQFDAFVQQEQNRRLIFHESIVRHRELIEEVSVDIAERSRADSEDTRIGPWPPAFLEAARCLTSARERGGNREGNEGVDLPAVIVVQIADEEKAIAECEAALAGCDRQLEKLARESFTRQRDQIESRIPSPNAEDADTVSRTLLQELASLRKSAASTKTDEISLAYANQPRVPVELVASLNVLEQRLYVVAGQSDE